MQNSENTERDRERDNTLIEASCITVRYPNAAQPALVDVSFSVHAGEVVGVIGSSGAGKSTFIKTLAGFVPYESGTLQVCGSEVSQLSGKELKALRQQIGFMFQDYGLIDRLTAVENVLIGQLSKLGPLSSFLGLYGKNAYEDACDQLELVGLGGFILTPTRMLSGGQRQRVALARILHQRSSLILADEPIAALDENHAHKVLKLLVDLAHSHSIGAIINLHDTGCALTYCDRICAFQKGKLVLDAPAHALTKQDLERCYE